MSNTFDATVRKCGREGRDEFERLVRPLIEALPDEHQDIVYSSVQLVVQQAAAQAFVDGLTMAKDAIVEGFKT